MKKTIALFLSLFLILSGLNAGLAETAQTGNSNGYTYTVLEDGSACITKCSLGGDLTIPEQLDGHPVTVIGEHAFDRNQKLEKLTIPEGVTAIESNAFYWCGNLKEVSIPYSLDTMSGNPFDVCSSLTTFKVPKDHPVFEVKSGVLFNKAEKILICYPQTKKGGSYSVPNGTLHIGDRAFSSGNEFLKSVSFPKSLLTIGDDAFHSCFNMKGALKLPAQLQSVGKSAFSLCDHLSTLSIPETLTEIGEMAFMGCEIKKITLAKNNPAFQLIDDVLFTADGKTLVYYPCRRQGEVYDVPEGTEKLMSGSFYWVQYLKELNIPEGVKSIGDYVVYVCYTISRVNLPASIEEIGESSLKGEPEDFVVTVPAGSYAEKWCRNKTYLHNGDWFYHLNYQVR